jgi:hypothetical protein
MRQAARHRKTQWKFFRQYLIGCRIATFACLVYVAFTVLQILDKRPQWPFLFRYPPSVGIPLWHSLWLNILCAAFFMLAVALRWLRVYNYRRERLVTEQTALQKAAKPVEGVWPPPPL